LPGLVIASEAKQSNALQRLDCFVADAPRNDEAVSIKNRSP
jgi:hypothetical protein